MSLLMEPGQTYNCWDEFKAALDAHCKENKVIFNIANAKTVSQSNQFMRRGPLFNPRLKYSHIVMRCKHYGSYTSLSAGLRPKQRSYKIDCRAFVSVSACRKQNILIIRDAYHKHSHPCTDEIYNSYPEVRRLTKDERQMVGTLLEMGVSVGQIKTAVGKNVTPKDLSNAKIYTKSVRQGMVNPGSNNTEGNKQSELLLDKMKVELQTLNIPKEQSEAGPSEDISHKIVSELSANNAATISTIEKADDNQHTDIPSSESISEDMSCQASNDDHVYTIVVSSSMPDTLGASTSGMYSLQQLFEKHQSQTGLVKQIPVPVAQSLDKIDKLDKGQILQQIQTQQEEGLVPEKEEKVCVTCGQYMSPLDGHSYCLKCLGPEHLHAYECKHCVGMKPEQLSIRKKLMVRMRMKSLREGSLKTAKSTIDAVTTTTSNSAVRKSNRKRKPRNFGDDMAVEDSFLKRASSPQQSNEVNVPSIANFPKKEKLDYDYGDISSEPSMAPSYSKSNNSDRFDHFLRQSSMLDDVVLQETQEGDLLYEPDEEVSGVLNKVMSQSSCTAIPGKVVGKYSLDHQFESSHNTTPAAVSVCGDSVVNSMSSGFRKLIQNSAMQTKIAVYDKLFTRLGVGMADEALDIISQLYSKITNVTEISQDDLTSNLQTALDTIQALKDLLEELGVMSKDALLTACHQRKVSIDSMNKARASSKRPAPYNKTASSTPGKLRKFQPFTQPHISQHIVSKSKDTDVTKVEVPEPIDTNSNDNCETLSEVLQVESSEIVGGSVDVALPQQHIVMDVAMPSDTINKEEVPEPIDRNSSDVDKNNKDSCEKLRGEVLQVESSEIICGSVNESLPQQHIVMEVALPSEISSLMNVSPMTISSELLERLRNQHKDSDGVIQINMMK